MDCLAHERRPTLADRLVVDGEARILDPVIGQSTQEADIAGVEILIKMAPRCFMWVS